jgi:hypothetical protein
MAAELKVIADFYDFMLWLTQHTEKFPRHHRYSLGTAIERQLQSILGLLVRAKYSREKAALLTTANIELEVLRFQMRLAKDLRILPVKSHGFGADKVQAIGAQVGGWLRSKGAGP